MPTNSIMAGMITQIPDALSLMGVNVTPFDSYSHALECISDRVENRRKTVVFAVNPEKIYRAYHDENLKKLINDADIRICDSAGVIFAVKLLYNRRLKRCTGVDLFTKLIEAATKKGWGVFLLGASHESNAKMCSNLLEKYPALKIAGSHDGYFQNSAAMVRQINASHADILFVAMGSPKQEFWLANHGAALAPLLCIGVGGTFDVVSGKVKRAANIFRKTGTEGLFRLLTHSGWTMKVRLKRGLVLFSFVLMVLKRKFLVFRRNPTGVNP